MTVEPRACGWKAALLIGCLFLNGCARLEAMYKPAQTVALQKALKATESARCDQAPSAEAPAYYLGNLRDCTATDTLVVFAFSGGGIRSASFGYGVLKAAHAIRLTDEKGTHRLDRDIDAVSGVSGGSFTAAAFASQRENLFADGKPDYYRDNFLTHDFFADLIKLYLSPLHWRWLFPDYGTNDEMAQIYADTPFSSETDKLFAADFGTLARKGTPFLVVQATDYGNEQPFTFTQNDFDLICSDIRPYPVGAAIAASSAFPILFSPIQLANHHFTPTTSNDFCHTHRPAWVDQVLAAPEPTDLSRLYARAKAVDSYLPQAKPTEDAPAYVYLQDGGASDNVALRGLTNILIQNFPHLDEHGPWHDDRVCALGIDRWRKLLIVAVDGEAQPNRRISSLPYLSDLRLILDVTSSTMIDANGFETMLATDAMVRNLAERLTQLDCSRTTTGSHPVKAYFARVSFQDLATATTLTDPVACSKRKGERCTIDDLAHSETSLAFTRPQVDALIDAGTSAFLCNRKIAEFLTDSAAQADARPPFACAASAPVTDTVKDQKDDARPDDGHNHGFQRKVEPGVMAEGTE